MRNGNFKFKRRTQVPTGAQILRAVWVLRRKRREVYKWKARLNIDGRVQIKEVSKLGDITPQ